MTNGTPPFHAHQQWGDTLPSDVLSQEGPANTGIRQTDGSIKCGGCGLVQPDNSLPGLKPSCSTCWTAIHVVDVTPSQHRFAFPPNYLLIG